MDALPGLPKGKEISQPGKAKLQAWVCNKTPTSVDINALPSLSLSLPTSSTTTPKPMLGPPFPFHYLFKRATKVHTKPGQQ